MMKRLVAAFLCGAVLFGGITLPIWGQGGVNALFNLPGKVDANNALVVSTVAIGSAEGGVNALGNLRGKVDANNALVVAIDGPLVIGERVTATVDDATTFAVTSSYTVLACTGAETIGTITGAVSGTILYLENSDTDCTLTDDNAATATDALDLTGSGDDTGAVAKVITLLYNGTSWLQVSESDN